MADKQSTLNLRDKLWLHTQYVERNKSSGDIAAELGCTDVCVQQWLKRHLIPRRTVSEARKVKHWGTPKPPSSNEELAVRIRSAVVVDEVTGCWNWQRGLFSNGYPCIKVDGKSRKGNRVSYEIFVGQIADGVFVCHKCDNKLCVNPEHLWLGTQLDNMQDAVRKGRMSSGVGHHSNKLTEDQVLSIRSDTRSQCLIARDHDVSPHTISAIKRKKKWRNLAESQSDDRPQ